MELLRRLCIQVRESDRGQTMTEYALVLGAIALVCYAGYQAMGTTISASLVTVNNIL